MPGLSYFYRCCPNSLFILLLPMLLSVRAGAQGKITGTVVDSVSGKPIDYASIGLLGQESNKEVNGATTNDQGVFSMDHVPFGTYKIAIYFIGYRNYITGQIVVSKAEPNTDVGRITLVSMQTGLREITVVAKTPVIENKIDKVVFNVENDVTSQGGAAIDILKKVPQVTVDIDGNVELQGNANIRFLINGKPSGMFGNSLADALASIPASQIKSIEAITSPGARYDAQGTGGIINIILKENKVKGVNGNVNLTAGTRFETGSLNLNLRNNNFGINAFLSGNAQLNSHTPNSQNRNSVDTAAETSTQLQQNGYTNFQRNGYRTGVGFDWTMNKTNSFTGSVAYNHFANQNKSYIDQNLVTYNNTQSVIQDVSSSRQADSRSTMGAIDWNLGYRKNFKKEGQELNINYTSTYSKPNTYYTQVQTYKGSSMPYSGTGGNNPGTDNQTNISIDYVHPVSDDVIFETGVKTIQQHIHAENNISLFNTSSDAYVADPLQSYHLNYDMAVYAAYLSSTFTVRKWLNVRAGARAEHTILNIDFPGTHIPSYTIVVPSLILSHKFKKEQLVKFAYSKRIERPEYDELNPFMNLSDPRNIITGNPALRPEIGNNFELGYSRNFENGGNVYVAAIERINTQDLKQIVTFYPTYVIHDSLYQNVSITKRQNIGTEYNTGLNISGSYPLRGKITLRGNFSATNRYIVSTIYVGNISMGIRYRANLNITWQLPKSLVVEVFGNYGSAAKNIQGTNPQSITYTLALRKQFWNKTASLGLTATNPFNQYISQVSTINSENYTSYVVREVPYRSFGITFTYKFGKMEFKKGKEDVNEYLNGPPTGN